MDLTPTIDLRHDGLTKPEAEAIINIRTGVDVYSFSLACTLRLMQRRGLPVNDYKHDPRLTPDHDALFDITEPKAYEGDGADQVPYFGAIATHVGIRMAHAYFEKRMAKREARA